MAKSLFCIVFTILIASAVGSVCKNPKVESTYFSSSDATIVTHIALIGEFSLKCADSSADGLSLFAEVDGKLSPVARVPGGKYQVSRKGRLLDLM